LILSKLVVVPVGFEDPVLCRVIRCIIERAAISIGTRKCREKNRFSVGWETEKFPHNHWTRLAPTRGIAEKMLVITVAPQNDICPQGSTYPRKAVAMVVTNRAIPDSHVIVFVAGDAKYSPRMVWM